MQTSIITKTKSGGCDLIGRFSPPALMAVPLQKELAPAQFLVAKMMLVLACLFVLGRLMKTINNESSPGFEKKAVS